MPASTRVREERPQLALATVALGRMTFDDILNPGGALRLLVSFETHFHVSEPHHIAGFNLPRLSVGNATSVDVRTVG